MAYNKHIWTTQELITSDKLNNIENGIEKNKNPLNFHSGNVTPVGVDRIANVSNIWAVTPYQDIIIDPRSGYKYLFTNLDSSDNALENLGIIELDQFNRVRSSMKVNHGVDNPSWLHGQFQDFNYFNTDDTKIEFLIAYYGGLRTLEYKPNKTVNYDDLPIFTTLPNFNNIAVTIDFDNKLLFTITGKFWDTDSTKYDYSFNAYSIDAGGNNSFLNGNTVTVDMPNGYIEQGVSAAPAKDFINDDGSIIFITSGWTLSDNSKNEFSIGAFQYKDGIFSQSFKVKELDKASFLSTSNNRLEDFHDVRNGSLENWKELQGSSAVKVNDTWVVTTALVYSRDTTTNSYSQRNKETIQLGFGDIRTLDRLKNIGKPLQKTYLGIESDTTNIYTQVLPGKYQISPSLFPNLSDAPVIFQGTTTSETIGGTGWGAESIELLVEQVGMHGRFKQTLTINSYSQLNHQDIVFTRYVQTNRDFGKDNSYKVGRWQMKPMNNIGAWTVFDKIKTSKTALLPGYQKFITNTNLSSFFAGDNVVPTVSGMFETLPLEIPLEANKQTARILQRYTTYETNVQVYERFISCQVDNYSSVFVQGIGGGYKSTREVGNWTKLTN